MKPLTLVRERCRVVTQPDGQAWLEVVYQLEAPPPVGTRQQLVLALEKALRRQGLELRTLDLFDEYIRLRVPLATPAALVEATLEEVLRPLAPAAPLSPEEGAQTQLQRYLSESHC